VNDKAMNAICQTLSPSKFSRISHCETAKEAWEVIETTYEGTQLVKFAKLQMLVSQFGGIKMLEEESFNEFYTKISDLRNSMINLGKEISNAKLIKKILRSLPERFRVKITTIEESKDLDSMRIEELVESLQTNEFSLPPLRKTKSIALRTINKKSENPSDEDGLAMFAINFKRLMNSSKGKLGTRMLNFLKIIRETPKELIKKILNLTKRIHVVLGVLNVQVMVIIVLVVEI
jgi:hypothetical protein